ncbi:uncharacterized protein [Nicotiana tomentosiformis]|uniref:uncharacterized protein n=1 Tax=Nicotiana tomentosiformis TaxID=4098 RepID=UPI00388C718B
MVKFEWDRKEIVVHGDENLSAYNDTIILFIEVEDDKGPWVYQMFETVSVGKIPEGECILGPKIPSASVMVANEMLKNGFLPGKGLGSSLQDIVCPVCPRESFGTFGLGFTLTGKDVKRAKSLKGKAWSLPKPIPHISKSFVKPGVAKRPISSPNLKSQSNSEITIQEVEGDDETEYDEEAAFEEFSRELKHFEEKPKPNLNETEAINLGDQNNQKLRKFKTNMSVKIKKEITKQLEAKVIRVTQYPTWLANVVPLPKKDGKTRVCFDYCDLNKASPKDNFPLPKIHILIDNCAKHEIGSFVDCYAGYHQILMDEEDTEKTAFITPWGTTCCALTWVAQKLKHYLSSYTNYLIYRMDPLKYIFQKPMPTGRLAKWQILLTEFNIIYVTRTAMKSQALADHLAENPVDEEYEPLKTYFPDEEVMYVDEADHDEKPGWKLFFDGAANMKGVGIGAVHGDLIHSPPSELHTMSAPWPFVAWGMDVIGPIEPAASNGHRFILVAIDYFTKWVEAVTFKFVTKKEVVDFVHSNIICRFGIPKIINTDNAANLNSHLMKEVCQQFKIMHRNSTPYRPKANRAVEVANKNIKKILRATPYLLVYGTEAVIPAEVEIPSLRIVVEAEIDDDEWVKTRLEQLSLIDEKRLALVCHGQLYQRRMARAYNKKGKEILFALLGIPHEESMFQISSALSFQDPPG